MTEQWPSHQIVGRPSFASAPWSHDRMQTLEDVQTWQGRKLVDADGDKIGTIEEILLDRQTGELAWAAVKTGLFGLEHTLVPIGDAEPVGDDEVRVHLDKETVKRAPRIDPGGELSAEDERRLWSTTVAPTTTGRVRTVRGRWACRTRRRTAHASRRHAPNRTPARRRSSASGCAGSS